MKYTLLAMLCMATASCFALPLPCKPNGQGTYGRSSVYDLGNPTHNTCWKERD